MIFFPEWFAGLRLMEDIIRLAEETFLYHRNCFRIGGALNDRDKVANRQNGGCRGGGEVRDNGETQ